MKEKELENREGMLQCSEQTAHDLEADDIFEYLLQEKEKDLTLKGMLLESRERQIKSREGQIKIGIHNTIPIPSKGSLNPQIKCEPVTANPSFKLLKLTEIADESTYLYILSCQPRVTVTICFVYKVISDLESTDPLFINPIHRIGLMHKGSIDSRKQEWSVQINVSIKNYKQTVTSLSLSLLVGTTVDTIRKKKIDYPA